MRTDPFISEDRPIYFFFAILLLAPLAALRAADLFIDNEVLGIRYTETSKTFSVLHKPTGRTFAKNATFPQPIEHAWLVGRGTPHPVFGQGKGIEFDHANGSVSRIALYPNQAFALMTSYRQNRTSQPLVMDKVPLFTAGDGLEASRRQPQDVIIKLRARVPQSAGGTG